MITTNICDSAELDKLLESITITKSVNHFTLGGMKTVTDYLINKRISIYNDESFQEIYESAPSKKHVNKSMANNFEYYDGRKLFFQERLKETSRFVLCVGNKKTYSSYDIYTIDGDCYLLASPFCCSCEELWFNIDHDKNTVCVVDDHYVVIPDELIDKEKTGLN